MHYIEKKQSKYFVTLAHATSFSNLMDIENHGLKPLSVNRQLVEAHIKKLLPSENEILLANRLLSEKSPAAALVKIRLNQSSRICFLPVTNLTYLKGAAANSLGDKGEIFKAIRISLEEMLGLPINPLCPQDKNVILTTKIEAFKKSEDEFEIMNPNDSSRRVLISKNANSTEIEINWTIPFSKLSVHNYQNFLGIHKIQANF